MKYIYLILLLFVLVTQGYGQDILTLKDAKAMALKNSYAIQVGENEINIVNKFSDLLAVGFKPTLGLSSGINGNLNSTITKFFAAPEASEDYLLPSWNANVRANAQYILWDGDGLDNQIKQNEERAKLSNYSLNATKETVIYQVENAYFNIVKLEENRAILKTSIEISQQRKERANYGFEFGTGNKLALLNAEVDLNQDSVNLLKFEQRLINAKRQLNLILNRDKNIDFVVETEIRMEENLTFEQFEADVLEQNLDLKMAKQQVNISLLDKKINDSNLKPFVAANASYGINFLDNSDRKAIDYNLGDGLQLGLSATWKLIDGGRTKIQNETSELRIISQNLRVAQLEDQINLEVANAWGDYENARLVYELSKKSINLAKENFTRTEERFKAGQISSIDFRQAQLNLLAAQLNLVNAKFDAKLIELELKQLSGQLL